MKKYYALSILLILISFFLSVNQTPAQSLRKVMIEEGTNASCPPCAAQNPLFEPWIERNIDRVIPVMYHASWPGPNDPMYLYNTGLSQTRINYYGIQNIGVPCGVMAGQFVTPTGTNYKGSVGDTAAWTAGLAKQIMYTPITITITLNDTNGTGSVKVLVTSTADVTTKKLRIVICEQHHHYDAAGSNGEKEFYYIAKRMVPDNNGVDIALAAYETKSYEYSYSIDPQFADGIYAVAYIQDDATKFILQAEATNSNTPQPDYIVCANQFDLRFTGVKDSSFSENVIIKNNTDSAAIFTLSMIKSSQTPEDWTTNILNDKSVITVAAHSIDSACLKFVIGTTCGIGEANLNVQLQSKSLTFATSKILGISEDIKHFHVLGGETQYSVQPIIDKKQGSGKYIDISLDNFSYVYPKLTNLKTYVWDGGATTAPTADDANLMKDAINNDIGVLICGGAITSSLVTNGVIDYFNASFIAYCREGYGSSPWPVALAGRWNDPISFDFGNNVAGHLIQYLLPLYKINDPSTTFPVMNFKKSNDSIFALRVQRTNSRAVLLGINPFVILDATIRENLIDRSIQYIEGTLNDVNDENINTSGITTSPNPVTDRVNLSFNVSAATGQNVRISIINELGETVKSLSEDYYQQGSNNIELDLSYLNEGMYYILFNSGTSHSFIPIVKIK
jgi:hypothetical protein